MNFYLRCMSAVSCIAVHVYVSNALWWLLQAAKKVKRKESSDDDLVLSKLKEKLKSPSKKKSSSASKKVVLTQVDYYQHTAYFMDHFYQRPDVVTVCTCTCTYHVPGAARYHRMQYSVYRWSRLRCLTSLGRSNATVSHRSPCLSRRWRKRNRLSNLCL